MEMRSPGLRKTRPGLRITQGRGGWGSSRDTNQDSASDETTVDGGKCAAAHVDLPDAGGPANTTRHGDGSSNGTAAA